jgi:hypothetical protein
MQSSRHTIPSAAIVVKQQAKQPPFCLVNDTTTCKQFHGGAELDIERLW